MLVRKNKKLYFPKCMTRTLDQRSCMSAVIRLYGTVDQVYMYESCKAEQSGICATALLIHLSNTLEAKTFMCVSHYALLPGGKNSLKMHYVKDA